MAEKLSPRLAVIVDALPLRPGMRVLEIGCGPGAAARAVAERIGNGFVLAIDRSANAIDQANAGSCAARAGGRLAFRHVAAEEFARREGEARFDLAFAIRVGAFDGRHPEAGARASARLRMALVHGGRLYIEGGQPLREIVLDND